MQSRGTLLTFALTNSIDKEKKDDKVEEEHNQHVEPFLNMLLPRDFLDLKISSHALNKMASFIHEFSVKLVEESVRAKEESKKDEVDETDVKKALIRLLTSPIENSGSALQSYSKYFEVIDQRLKVFEQILSARPKWKLMKEKKNVKIHQMDDPERPEQPLWIGTGTIDAPVESIKNVMIDLNCWKFWDPLFESGSDVETIDNHTKVVYLKYAANVCLIKQSRDFVIITYWFQKKDGSFIGVGCSVTHPLRPEYNESGCLRGEILNSGYEIVPDPRNPNSCSMTYFAQVDLKGDFIPEPIKSTFINLIAERQPLNVASIRKLVTGKE